jgi:hypothetical protein
MELETDHAAKSEITTPHASAAGDLAAAAIWPSAKWQQSGAAIAPRKAAGLARPAMGGMAIRSAQLVAANAGDYSPIHALLRAVNQSPTYLDFVSRLDEPSYAPGDRLLVKESDRIVAHVQVLHRAAMFGDVRVPIGGIQDLAVLPELVPLGYDRVLLDAAEHAMFESHAALSIARTEAPDPLIAAGWAETLARGYSQANVGDLLAHLAGHVPPVHRRPRGLRIRLWRHVELDAVRAVYRAASAGQWGALVRSEQYWQWLVGRQAHSDLIVAVEGPDAWEDLSTESRIVGYAVIRGAQVLEICCLAEYGRAAPRLLERACQDAIERDYHTLSLHTPPDDPLHEFMVTAGGSWRTDERGAGGSLLVKLLDAPRWIEALDPLLRVRTKAAGIARPCEIGWDVAGQRYRLILTRRSSRLVADDQAIVNVRVSPSAFSNLLVGNLSAARASAEGQLTTRDDNTLRLLAVLFPTSLYWQSLFDTLRM